MVYYSALHHAAKAEKSAISAAESADRAERALLPDQSNNAGKYLTTDGTNPSWAELNLTNKANSDLSNVASVASSFKEQSVGWGMPDYSAEIDIKSSVISVNGYTCVSCGQCFFRGNSNSDLTIIINGQTVMVNSTPTGYAAGFAFNVDKGDVIKGNNVYSAQFFPLKGVN